MSHRLLVAPSIAFALLGLSLAAQSQQAPTRTLPAASQLDLPEVIEIHTPEADPALPPYTPSSWAAGADYKVRFGSTMTFIPYLGSEYPHNQPFGWQTVGVSVGGEALPLTAPNGRAASPTRYEYELGSVVEVYDVRLEGLKQSFVLRNRPGSGELRIEGQLETKLRTTPGMHGHHDLSFVDEAGHPIVGYGKAIAFDANGRRWPVSTEVANDRITLSLAAEAVASAAYPLVVDPLLTNTVLATYSTFSAWGEARAVDIARDDENNQLMVAYQRDVSADDIDLYLRMYDDGFSASLGIVYSDLDTTWDTVDPKVAYSPSADRWITVFTRDFDSTDTKWVRWHPHIAGSTAGDQTVGFLINPGLRSQLHPTVGAFAGNGDPTNAVLCLQRDINFGLGGTHTSDPNSRIFYTLIDLAGTAGGNGAGSSTPMVELTGADPNGEADRERPSINRQGSTYTNSSFLVAWQTLWTNPPCPGPFCLDDWDVEGRRLDAAGGVLTGTWISANSYTNSWHKMGPQVDGYGDEYVIGYSMIANPTALPLSSPVPAGSRIACESYDWWTQPGVIGMPQVVHEVPSGERLTLTGISYDSSSRSHAVLVYHDNQAQEVYATKVGYRNRVVESLTAYSQPGNQVYAGGAVFDRDGTLSYPARHAFVFGVTNGSTQPVYGNFVDYVATSLPTPYGNQGCTLGAVIEWTFIHRLGHEHGRISLISGRNNRLSVCLISLGSDNTPLSPFGFGSCNLLVDAGPLLVSSTLHITDLNGNASQQVPVPGNLQPFTAYFQWIQFPFTGIPITSGASQGMSVEFDR